MQALPKLCAALGAAAGMLLIAQTASAYDRPAYCPERHDHRSHSASYYDYYDADRYSRAGDYRRDRNYDRRDRRGRYHRRYHRPRSEVVFRRHINLRRFNAHVTVVEENYWTRSGRVQRVCSIVPKGRDAYYVPQRRLSRIANNHCSRYARVQYL